VIHLLAEPEQAADMAAAAAAAAVGQGFQWGNCM